MLGASKYFYMLVTPDEYELPLIVEESPSVLADKCGVSMTTVISGAVHHEHGRSKSRYVRARRIEEDEE